MEELQPQIRDHVNSASGDYTRDCNFDPVAVAAALAARNVRVLAAVVPRDEAGVVALSGGLRVGISQPGAPPLAEIPGSSVITRGNELFIFAPLTFTIETTATQETTATIFKTLPSGGGIGKTVRLEEGTFQIPPLLERFRFDPTRLLPDLATPPAFRTPFPVFTREPDGDIRGIVETQRDFQVPRSP